VAHWIIGYVHGPHLIGAVNRRARGAGTETPYGPDAAGWCGRAGRSRRSPSGASEWPRGLRPTITPVSPQQIPEHPAAGKGMLQMAPRQSGASTPRLPPTTGWGTAYTGRSGDRQDLALLHHRQRVLAVNHRFALARGGDQARRPQKRSPWPAGQSSRATPSHRARAAWRSPAVNEELHRPNPSSWVFHCHDLVGWTSILARERLARVRSPLPGPVTCK